ncbi:hypothetical protein HYN51_06580 [Limnobaculum parvum]|uniref:Uncharacterized protein n=1 Tax=Limnobaculum parvum TaxID=2172103 RepID=A0A2Y9TX15_9GAMM|nr:hypothetical protein HYN51_06580 [Limnobaculum parvum]
MDLYSLHGEFEIDKPESSQARKIHYYDSTKDQQDRDIYLNPFILVTFSHLACMNGYNMTTTLLLLFSFADPYAGP